MRVSFFIHNEIETEEIEKIINNFLDSKNGKQLTEVLSFGFTRGDNIIKNICNNRNIEFKQVLEFKIGSLRDKNMSTLEKVRLYRHCSNELISVSDFIVTIYPKNLKDAIHVIDEANQRKIKIHYHWI